MRWVFGLLMFCYLALGAMVVWEGHVIAYEVARSKRNMEGVALLSRFQRSLSRMQTFLEKYQILGERVWIERFGVEKDMATGLASSLSEGGNPMSSNDRAKFARNWQEYLALADSAFSAQEPKTKEIYVMRAAIRQEEMSLLLENTMQDVIRARTSAPVLIWINLGIAILVVILGLATFLRMVVFPARRLAKEAKRIAFGDLEGPVTMRAPGRLGEIAEILETLRMNLLETREQVKRLISRRPGIER